MNNTSMSVSDAIRYLVVGIQPIIIIRIQNSVCPIKGIDLSIIFDSGVFMLAISFLSGLLIYSLYKPIIADYFIALVQDGIRYIFLWKYSDFHNHRTFIKQRFSIRKFHVRKPQIFWFYVSPHLKKGNYRNPYLVKQSSIIHLLYQTALICFIAIYLIENYTPILHKWLTYIGWSSLIMGFIYDGYLESFIYRLLRGMKEEKLDKLAEEFGLSSDKESN